MLKHLPQNIIPSDGKLHKAQRPHAFFFSVTVINSKKKKKKIVKLRSSLPISKHLQEIRECVFECTDDIFGQHT